MKRTLLKNAVIVNEGKCVRGSVVIEGEIIKEILGEEQEPSNPCQETMDASGGYLLPGIIDEHVHFRDPGLTHKADIVSESRAAVAGGVTSIMDMPNTNPQTVTMEALNRKFDEMGKKSLINYSCYFGATNENYTEFRWLDVHRVCGIKVFMGSSTGNMLVDERESLRHIFGATDLLVATHCEDQTIIKKNTEKYRKEADDLPLEYHSLIRSTEACYESSSLAVRLAKEMGTRLHVLHVTTAKELGLLADTPLNADKRITAEVCVPHLLFTSSDYAALGSFIKCNPAIKEVVDREALRSAVNSGWIDVIATDHAPHLLDDKEGGALKAASGMPMVQFSLLSMLRLVDEGVFSMEKVVEKMCHAPAKIYVIYNRGYIRTGYQADLVVVKPAASWRLTGKDILSTCKWSPMEGEIPLFTDSIASNRVMLSKALASKLKLGLGDRLYTYYYRQETIRARRLIVAAIYQTNFAEYDNLFLVTDLYTVNRLNNWNPDQATGLELQLRDYDKLEEMTYIVGNEFIDHVDRYGSAYCVRNITQLNPSIFAWLDLLNLNVWVVLILMTGVAGFTMISGLLILIIERTGMIGLLKALGATNDAIRKIFLWLSVLLIGKGMLWGNVIGLLLYFVQSQFKIFALDPESYYVDSIPMSFNVWTFLLLNAGTLLASVIMLILPSFLVSRINPATSMRYE